MIAPRAQYFLCTVEAMPRDIEGKLAEFALDEEVLIIDSQYTANEYQKHVGWGQGCVADVVRFALEARVTRLYLFHPDPAHEDRGISRVMCTARAVAPGSAAAKPGWVPRTLGTRPAVAGLSPVGVATCTPSWRRAAVACPEVGRSASAMARIPAAWPSITA